MNAVSTGEWTAHVECMGTALAAFGKNARRAIDEANDLKDADTTDLQVALDGRTHVQK